jgi:type 1 glutamine amidotransferase
MNRRQWLQHAGLATLALGTSSFPRAEAATRRADKRRMLMYTRSVGFQHDCVRRKGDSLSLAERIVTELGAKHGFDVVCEKDGRVFLSSDFPKFDGFLFETQGDLCSEKCLDGSPPMTPDGKKALLDAVRDGKGFAGCHCASDTFHSPGGRWENQPADQVDPYIAMVGGEFSGHGSQQKARMRVIDPHFPGLKDLKDFESHAIMLGNGVLSTSAALKDLQGFELQEEWYSLKNFAPDMHVILVQETGGMHNFDYERPDYPATWARPYGKGRVFYTSMGHRDDVWQNPVFQTILLGGLFWILGDVQAEVPPNLDKVAPHASELPKKK